MSRDIQHFFCIGRLVKDPELKYTANGMSVTNFSIAVNDSFKQGDKYVDYANFFEVTVFGSQALNCDKYLKKGSQAAVHGKLKQNRWTDKATGQTRNKIVIIADSIQFLSPVRNAEGSNKSNVENVFGENTVEDPWANGNNENPFQES